MKSLCSVFGKITTLLSTVFYKDIPFFVDLYKLLENTTENVYWYFSPKLNNVYASYAVSSVK
jgi:hypothetical protein